MLNHLIRRLLRVSVATAAVFAALAPPRSQRTRRRRRRSRRPADPDDQPRRVGGQRRGHTITGIVHGAPPSWGPGTRKQLRVDASVDLSAVALHTIVGLQLKRDDSGVEVIKVVAPNCNVQPAPQQNGEGAPPPGFGPDQQGGQPQGADGQPGQQGGPMDLPVLSRSFLNRVWKLEGSADGYEDGVLNITLERVLNLPRAMRAQDDELVDQDAMVLIGRATRVYDSQGARSASAARPPSSPPPSRSASRASAQAQPVAQGRGRQRGHDDPGQEGLHPRLTPQHICRPREGPGDRPLSRSRGTRDGT